MALSDGAWSYLGKLKAGTAKNRPTLIAGLGGKSVLEELVQLGHVEERGGRYARTAASEHAFKLFDALPEDGSSLGNATARKRSGLTPPRYEAAKSILLRSGEISRGRGKGGSVRRIASVEIGGRAGAAARESDLYEPFRLWLEGQVKEPGQIFTYHHVTGHGKRQRRTTGQWSRPDVVSVVVTNHPMLPGSSVTVSTYELKPYAQAANLAGVYEASAHQRRAHRANLVIEWPLDEDHEPPGNVQAECQRLGVGLLRIWEGDAEWVFDPTPTAPLPATLNEFITDLIAEADRPNYLKAIGRPDELGGDESD